jgi:hypothetical protein
VSPEATVARPPARCTATVVGTELPTDNLLPVCRRYAEHVGIHYVLCSKLRQFAYEEIEFFLPQYVVLVPRADGMVAAVAAVVAHRA